MAQTPIFIVLIFLGRLVASISIIGAGICAALALHYQMSSSLMLRIVVFGALLGVLLLALCAVNLHQFRAYRWPLLLLMFVSLAAVLVWWLSIKPSLSRDWADDVAQTVTADINGDQVRLHNIRDFDWRSETDYTANWKSADYDISQITNVDLYLSYWAGPAIAHTLVGFSFSDGRHLVFSAEIRKKSDQSFSEIGGFFKQYELAMIAAEEQDIIYLRTNVRGERVYRYPVNVPQPQAAELFRLYLDRANDLAKKPAFYNTLTTNCTTVVFDMARVIDPAIVPDYRVLLSGYLPEYIHGLGLTGDQSQPIQMLRREADITQRAVGPREGYSQRIRQ